VFCIFRGRLDEEIEVLFARELPTNIVPDRLIFEFARDRSAFGVVSDNIIAFYCRGAASMSGATSAPKVGNTESPSGMATSAANNLLWIPRVSMMPFPVLLSAARSLYGFLALTSPESVVSDQGLEC
jgi:hypothetical protein